jgi:hypothetical protein
MYTQKIFKIFWKTPVYIKTNNKMKKLIALILLSGFMVGTTYANENIKK